MEGKKKYFVGSVVVVIIIIVTTVLITKAILTPVSPAITRTILPLKPSVKQTNLLKLTTGSYYDIVGNVSMYGMHVKSDKLNNVLKKKTRNGEDIYTYIFFNGKLPEEFVEELKFALLPGFVAQTTDEMYVGLNLAVDGTTIEVKVKTGDWITTFIYFILATKGNCVSFLSGNPPDSEKAIIGSRTFQCSKVYLIDDIVAGTPYNFSPTTKTVLDIPPQPSGDLNIPPLN